MDPLRNRKKFFNIAHQQLNSYLIQVNVELYAKLKIIDPKTYLVNTENIRKKIACQKQGQT